MLHVIYRSHGGENKKVRPEYYSKLLTLMSFIRAFRQLSSGAAEIIFLNDGPIPRDRLEIMEKSGEVLARSNLGMRGSWNAALALPAQREWPDDDLVWLAEDDYLYLPHALNDLVSAAEAYPQASYFGLYAMVGSRLPNGKRSEDRVPHENQLPHVAGKLVNGHPWRGATSTASTFGARVKPLREDRSMMRLGSRSGGAWDHTICRMYQGFMPYPISSLAAFMLDRNPHKNWLHRAAICVARIGLDVYQALRLLKSSSRRVLVAPDPALATHLETQWLATGTDWRAVAADTSQWVNAWQLGPANRSFQVAAPSAAE